MRVIKLHKTNVKILRYVVAGMLLLLMGFFIIPLPDPLFEVPYATSLKSSDGTLLSVSIARDHQWRLPPSDSIPEKFETAIRLFEDEYFYYHPGINPFSLIRALHQNIRAGRIVSGGSTISMQTIRLAYGNKPRTYLQKLVEVISTIKMELLYSKRAIIKTYADHAPFGGNIVGINAASWRYFGRPPYQLSWAETATLAILPNDPSSIFPGKNQKILLQKRNYLLNKIYQKGYMDDDAFYLACQETLPESLKPLPDYAYHLLHRSISEGYEGKEVQTTLDKDLQLRALRKVIDYSKNQSYNQIHNAAAIIIDIESGNTLAYIGNSKNEGDHGQHVDIITSRRSPGSLLKPILYAASLDDGLITPYQLLPDIPIFYKGFAPKNFDKEYRGAVAADKALSSSLNVPFVHLLIDYGYEKFHQTLLRLGFSSFDQPAGHYGLSLILGGAETTLWEITGVYAGMMRALQNYEKRPYRSGYSSYDYRGNRYLKSVLKSAPGKFESDGYLRVPSLYYTFDAMQRVKRPFEEAGWKYFESSRSIAWKTGTSYGFRDAWAIGLDNKYLVGVWIGNADGEGRPGLTGISAAAPLLFELFDLLDGGIKNYELVGFEQKVCVQSGMIATKRCPETLLIQMPDYMLASNSCLYHKIINLNQEGTYQVNSSCYEVSNIQNVSWFVLPPVQSWYYEKYNPTYKKPPPYLTTCQQTDNNDIFDLIYPGQYTRVHIPIEQAGQRGHVIFEATHTNRNSVVYWHLDESYLGYTQGTHQKGIQTKAGQHTLTLIDESGNEINQRFEVVN